MPEYVNTQLKHEMQCLMQPGLMEDTANALLSAALPVPFSATGCY